MFGFSPSNGYMAANPLKVSRGPWFKEFFATDDGLEFYYQYTNEKGKNQYILSNNIPWRERETIA